MRLHSAVGYPLERLVPKGGTDLCGVHIPGGTRVGINAWVIHMNKDIFGDDVREYRPERWIECSPEQFKVMERSFLAVSAQTVHRITHCTK
jgi:cytochrome P450